MRTFHEWLSKSKTSKFDVEAMAASYGVPLEKFLADGMEAYGPCPICGQPGIMSERRIDGNTFCAAGHAFKRK